MKKIYLMLLIMIPSVSTSQNTDINLLEAQQIEVYKGLKQGEFIKEIIQDKDNQISELEDQFKKDSELIKKMIQKIENLEKINNNNQRFIEYQEQELDLRLKKEKQKRFGIGFISGYGFAPDFKNNAFIGLGLSYNIFRF